MTSTSLPAAMTATTLPTGHRALPVLVPGGASLAPAAAPASANPALVYLAGLAPGSRRTLRDALNEIACLVQGAARPTPDDPTAYAAWQDLHAVFPWPALRYPHTQAIRNALAAHYSHRTVNKMLAALRGVLKECWRLGLLSAEEYQRAVDLKAVAGETPSQAETGRHLTLGELMALLAACAAPGGHPTAAGARDAAIVALGYACGLRRAELAHLQVPDFDTAAQRLMVRAGKRNRTRAIPLANGALDALRDWLHVRGMACPADAGPLFVRIRKGDHVTGEGMTSQAIYNVLQARARAAGVKAFTPHDLRRTFAGDLLDAGADIVTVQQIMGHSSPTTTAGYDRRGERAKRDAVARLHVPYQRHSK